MTIKTTTFTHRPRGSLAQFSFCWWHHNRLLMTSQWPDYCDAITWIMISNSLDIDFIHGDIHGRSCKKGKVFTKIMFMMLNSPRIHWVRSATQMEVKWIFRILLVFYIRNQKRSCNRITSMMNSLSMWLMCIVRPWPCRLGIFWLQ